MDIDVDLEENSVKTVEESLDEGIFRTYYKRCPDILECIVSHSALPELVAIASVCRQLRWLVQHDLRRRYTDLLSPFVSDVAEVSRILKRTRTAISGSQVLQFMDPSNAPWKDTAKDLDLYTTEDKFVDLVGFFINKENFYVHTSSHVLFKEPELPEEELEAQEAQLDEEVAIDSGTFDHFHPGAISSVTQLRRGEQRIDIIVSQDPYSSTLPIFNFHSTIVMNFLTPDSIFCSYPHLTFKKRGLFSNVQKVKERTTLAYQKYANRGYTLARKPTKWDKNHSAVCVTGHCRGERTTLDKGNLYFPFDSAAGQDDSIAFDYYRNILGGRIKWSLGGKACTPHDHHRYSPFVTTF